MKFKVLGSKVSWHDVVTVLEFDQRHGTQTQKILRIPREKENIRI
jgi:hypothetical protein